MSISSIAHASSPSHTAAPDSPRSTTHQSNATFASTLAQLSNGTPYTDAEVKRFFAGNPSAEQIASKAASLGLTKDQVAKAMTVGGYGPTSDAELRSQIDSFVATVGNGYTWDTRGALQAVKTNAQGATPDKALPAANDIKAFFAAGPSDAQVTAKAKSLGLNAAQLVQFQATGMGMDMNKISAHVLETMYVDAANRLGTDIGGGPHGGWTAYFSPTQGRTVTKSEMQAFFATNPSQSQIFQKASELGLGVSAVNNMMVGLGLTNAQDMYSAHAQMDMALFRGDAGYSLDQYGHIVAGGGKVWSGTANSGTWLPRTPDSGTAASANA